MNQIKIREIQHYMYCPHRWGLMEIDMSWSENYFVIKANLMHERVHNPEKKYSARGKKVLTSITVYNDQPEYGIYGVTDCIELISDSNGDALIDRKKYKLKIVEYKQHMPQNRLFREDDAMQVFAQKVCVDSIFKCDASCEIYYADQKHRVIIPFNDTYSEYDSRLKKILCEMRKYKSIGKIPQKRKGQYCNGCSLRDLCIPEAKKTNRIRSNVLEMIEEEM